MQRPPWGLVTIICGGLFFAAVWATAYYPILGGRLVNYIVIGGIGIATWACLRRARAE